MLSSLISRENIFEKRPGIYGIVNSINGNVYIGQTNNLRRRFIEHRLAKNTSCKLLSRAIKKYGIEHFSFGVYDYCTTDQLNEREILYIKELSPAYNITSGGKGAKNHTLSDETKRVLSQKCRAAWDRKTDEEKRRIIKNLRPAQKGHPVSEETREKLRKASTGKKQSEETIRKRAAAISIALMGNKNGLKNKNQNT